MTVRRAGAGVSAAGLSWGMCQPVEEVAAKERSRSSLLPASLSLWLTREREAGVRGSQMSLRPTPTLRPHRSVSSFSDSTASGEALTGSTYSREGSSRRIDGNRSPLAIHLAICTAMRRRRLKKARPEAERVYEAASPDCGSPAVHRVCFLRPRRQLSHAKRLGSKWQRDSRNRVSRLGAASSAPLGGYPCLEATNNG
jgi:hypothetical protein